MPCLCEGDVFTQTRTFLFLPIGGGEGVVGVASTPPSPGSLRLRDGEGGGGRGKGAPHRDREGQGPEGNLQSNRRGEGACQDRPFFGRGRGSDLKVAKAGSAKLDSAAVRVAWERCVGDLVEESSTFLSADLDLRFKNTTKIPREDTQKKEQRMRNVVGDGKKTRKFGPLHPSGPHFSRFGAPPLQGPTLRGIGLAKIGVAQIGQMRMARNGLAKVGLFRPTLRRTLLPWTSQNFAFFPSPATIFILSSLSLNFGGDVPDGNTGTCLPCKRELREVQQNDDVLPTTPACGQAARRWPKMDGRPHRQKREAGDRGRLETKLQQHLEVVRVDPSEKTRSHN